MINKCLVVCNNRCLRGFTYGRIYRIIDDPDLYDTGYYWINNDTGVVKATPRSFFVTLDQFKSIVINRNMVSANLFRSGFYEED
jgi:hypothetical protein